MKTNLLWALLLTGGMTLLQGCASNNSSAISDADDTADVEAGVWQEDEAGAEDTLVEAEAASDAVTEDEPVAEPVMASDASGPGDGDWEWDAMAEGTDMSGDEMMAVMMEFASPGEHHEHLNHFVGDWNIKSTMWVTPESGEAMEMEGKAHVRSILGGRYLTEDVSMGEGMQEFQGFCLTGFDKRTDKYFYEWADTWGTGTMRGEGECDGSGKVFTYYASYDMPGMGVTEYKSIITIVNPRMHIFEMFTKGEDGDYWQNMELVYTRQ